MSKKQQKLQCTSVKSVAKKPFFVHFFLDMNVISLYFDAVILCKKLGEVCDSFQGKKLESGPGVGGEFLSTRFS